MDKRELPLDKAIVSAFGEFHDILKELTDISCCLRYPDGTFAFQLADSKDMGCGLCSLINSDPHGAELCKKNDIYICELVKRTKQPVYLTCHAGFIDFAVPVMVDNVHVATINGGQLAKEPIGDKGFQNFRENLNKQIRINWRKAKFEYLKKQYIPAEKLSSIIKLVSFIAEFICEMYHRLKIEKLNTQNPEILKALAFIRENFKHSITRDTVSDLVGMSPSHFSREFTKVVGTPYVKFVQTLRLNHAKEMLAKTTVSITKAALDSGFESLPYFNQIFLKHEKCSPKVFRQKIKGLTIGKDAINVSTDNYPFLVNL